MAIVAIDPADWKNTNVVQIDSDAVDNKVAIMEIESWAWDRQFARTNEYWLRQIVRDDTQRVFRGICYRLTREVRNSRSAESEANRKLLDQMPKTPHQAGEDR